MKKIFFFFSLFATGIAFGQKLSNKLTFTKGQQLQVSTNMNISSETMMGAMSGTVNTTDTYLITAVEGNTYTLVKTPKQAKIHLNFGSQEIKLDSDNPEDMNGMFGEQVKELMNQKPEFTIDASGKVIAVKQAAPDNENQSGMMNMMLPGMDMAASLPKKGEPSLFRVLPNREVSVGDTWSDTLKADGNEALTVYTLKEITGSEALLEFKSEGKITATQNAGGMTVDVNAVNRSTGTVTVDKVTGMVKQRTVNNTTESNMNLGGNEMNTTVKTTGTVTISTL